MLEEYGVRPLGNLALVRSHLRRCARPDRQLLINSCSNAHVLNRSIRTLVRRTDVADFLVAEIDDARLLHKTPAPTGLHTQGRGDRALNPVSDRL